MWKSWQDYFFFTEDYTENFHCTCNPQLRQPILCQNYWLEKLKVILSVSSPSSNPGEASLFSCVSSPTCRCRLLSPPSLPLLLSLLSSYWHRTSCYLGIYTQAAASAFSLDADPRESPLGSMSLAQLTWAITWKAFSGHSALWWGFFIKHNGFSYHK